MRAILFSILLLSAAAASAGTMEKCWQQEQDDMNVPNCFETERYRSANMLRKQSLETEEAVNQKTKNTGAKKLQRAYRAAQARYVRQRAAACSKEPAGRTRQSCEADMDYAHIEKLEKLTSQEATAVTPTPTPTPKK